MSTYLLPLVAIFLALASCSAFGGASSRTKLKADILSLARQTERGLIESPEQRAKMKLLFEQLEKQTPTKQSLKSKDVSGVWELKYTTSDTILGRGSKFKRVGPILQSIDVENLKAENSETLDCFGLFKLSRKVSAELVPVSASKVDVFFKQFTIGPWLKIKAPSSFKGALDITFVDSNFRLSRGDKGNLFVLTK